MLRDQVSSSNLRHCLELRHSPHCDVFANLFGQHPSSSFWSNFERMDGYVSLVHTFLYMLVLGSMLQTKQHWNYLLNTSLAVAFAVAFYGLAQYGGLIDGSSRIDSRLGNAAYMAIYMLFHIFIAFWLFVESRSTQLKLLYGFWLPCSRSYSLRLVLVVLRSVLRSVCSRCQRILVFWYTVQTVPKVCDRWCGTACDCCISFHFGS